MGQDTFRGTISKYAHTSYKTWIFNMDDGLGHNF